MEAVQTNRLDLLEQALREGEDPNTFLGPAVIRNRVAMVKMLLQWGADLCGDERALWNAIQFKNEEIVRLFLDTGCSPDANSLRVAAIRPDNTTIVKMLLMEGVPFRERDLPYTHPRSFLRKV